MSYENEAFRATVSYMGLSVVFILLFWGAVYFYFRKRANADNHPD